MTGRPTQIPPLLLHCLQLRPIEGRVEETLAEEMRVAFLLYHLEHHCAQNCAALARVDGEAQIFALVLLL